MSKKQIKIAAVILLAFVIGVVLWYKIPIGKQFTTILCSKGGQQVEAVFDVSWQRYIFAPTELKGTITLDGVEYLSIMDTNAPLDRGGFFEKLEDKLSSTDVTHAFVLPGLYDGMESHSNRMYLWHADKNFDTICIAVMKDGEQTDYYGPAKTAEEVENIIEKLSK